MKAKLIVEGREFSIEIQDPEFEKLLQPQKKTGYERVKNGEKYYSVASDNTVYENTDSFLFADKDSYDVANYYSDVTVAENNARADKLMRQLRRFAVEHRENDIDWRNATQVKFMIAYNSVTTGGQLCVDRFNCLQHCGCIYFDRIIDAELAIKTFHDELIWYFTEYKDSL